MSHKKLYRFFVTLTASLALLVLSSCGGGSSDSGGEMRGFIDLTVNPPIESSMSYSETEGVIFQDSPSLRKLIRNGARMTFNFRGMHRFSFRAVGSTIQGVSYSYLNIYINGELVREAMFLSPPSTVYDFEASLFSEGTNIVELELTPPPDGSGGSHAWIYEAMIES